MTDLATRTHETENPFHVVGIGASAGGLEALEQFFDSVPADSGMAFVIVQHLSPDFKSLMDELLARHTSLPIRLVEDGMRVERDHVYLIPPKKEMIISQGRLLLSERARSQELTLPIDVFFRSLAQDCRSRAVAVVLSGGGSDGSRGIRDVHEAGGLVVVQDVGTAQFDGMPRNAQDSGVADFILPPREMASVLLRHVQNGAFPRSNRPDGHLLAPVGIDAIYGMLQSEFGLDFTHYKPSTVTRRIERRLELARVASIDDYVERLKTEREELDRLYRDLLIGVTSFFRNPEAFAVLEQRVLPELLEAGRPDEPFRVWVAGCATGEEAYSLAISLAELSREHGDRPIKIFATDVHPGSIEVAARGVYDEEAVTKVEVERLERYFLVRPDGYQVIPDIRQMVVFAQHNMVNDPPFTRIDLLSCRNVLIYLQPNVQQRVLSLFHFALNRGGALFLGPSESAGALAGDFENIDRHWRVYRKQSDVRVSIDSRFRVDPQETRASQGLRAAPTRHSPASLLAAYDALLDEAMGPSLLVTARGELIHSFGGASRFLELRDGRQNLDVTEAVDGELRMAIVGGLQRVKQEQVAVVFRGIPIPAAGDAVAHKITVRPVGEASRGYVLIAFEALQGAPETPVAREETEVHLDEVSQERVSVLETELAHAKENLQAAIEEMETSNQELQTTNEELLASNEELQTTNEELQSVNEELYTVNAEYQRKIGELTELTNDMDNLLVSTDVGAIFLDADLKIRKFTPQMADSFALLPQDVGRPIETFTHKLHHPALMGDLRAVLARGTVIEREVRDTAGRAFFLRVLPYRARATIDGVVLTLIDVSGLKAAEDALFHERYLLNSLLTSVPDAIYFKDARGRFIRVNEAMAARLGLDSPDQVSGKTALELPKQDLALSLHHEDQAIVASGGAQKYRLEQRAHPDGGTAWDLVTRLPLIDRSQTIVGVVGVIRDVTEQKRAEEHVQAEVRRRDEFLAMLSHELRNPLGAIANATALLESGVGDPERHPATLQIIKRQTSQMARLLDDLLDAGRVTQNKIELRRATVDLRAVIEDAIDGVDNLIKAQGHALATDLGDEPLYVDGDPARLQQVVVNLLTNAAKYTPPRGHLELTARPLDGHAVLTVRDDGVGIPEEAIGGIFDLFVQSNRTLDRSDGGLGVGLTLVRSLVALHGGTVSARSDGEGKGSEFTVTLPRASAPHAEAPEGRRRRLAPGARIAVVEDNADSREMLCAILEVAGFECRSAGRGDDGLELITEMRPDVALVDVGLPGLSGFDVARLVREDPSLSEVQLVALTGYGRPKDRERALEAGFDLHLVKPFDLDTLCRLVGFETQRTTSGA